MELKWIGVAFVLGLAVRRLGQPPLLGFLAAGFLLEFLGLRPDVQLVDLANIGVLLLLFAIGLKLDLRSLIKPYVFGLAAIHMALITLALGGALFGLAALLPVGPLVGLDGREAALIGFAASFSSTVYVVKLLEARNDSGSFYGQVALGILIVQDVVAVVFLAVSKGEWPSLWAFALLALPLLRPLVGRLLGFAGHGELLLLAGLSAALGGAALFEVVGLKADLGALVAGLICAGHSKSEELAKTFVGLKDVFLVGFFLTIGLTGLPTWETFAMALALSLVLPIKAGLFFWLATRMRLRARTALLLALSLGNFSEFGLIVGTVAVSVGWLDASWLVTLALAAGVSFFFSSLLDARALELYRARRDRLARFETKERVPEERAVEVGRAEVLVFGMGRVGAAAFDAVRAQLGDEVVGFDNDDRVVSQHVQEGRRVVHASATDADFWERLRIDREGVRLVLLAMASHEDNRNAIRQIRREGFTGPVAAVIRFEDEAEALEAEGADLTFHVLGDVGLAFAARGLRLAE